MSETKATYTTGQPPGDERATRLAAIAERAAARTPGRWRWRGNASGHSVSLQAVDRLCDYVLSFKRWGMQGAIPWFQRDPQESAGIERAKLIPRTHYDPWTIVGIDHPDARFIEHAPEDIDWLLGELAVAEARSAELAHAAERYAYYRGFVEDEWDAAHEAQRWLGRLLALVGSPAAPSDTEEQHR